MPASDDDYVQPLSDDDAAAHTVSRRRDETSTSTRGRAARQHASDSRHAGHLGADDDGGGGGGGGEGGGGFELARTWETVVEGEDGTISGAVEGMLEAGKRKRLLKDTTPLQRGIIRHLIVILDASAAMLERDLRPSRFLLTIRLAVKFVHEFFEQNPLAQLGFIAMRDGVAMRVSPLGGNPSEHIIALQRLLDLEPQGHASLQNALEMARGALFHAPSHGTREVLLVFGALLSSDPGDLHTTIAALVKARITCSVIGLAAEVAICRTIVTKTNPSRPSTSCYNVALNEQHYRELFMVATTPPPTTSASLSSSAGVNGASTTNSGVDANASSLLMMGFPSRVAEAAPSLCACHARPCRGGYRCARCHSKVCALPCTCPVCGLTLILSTHLARSYHHLFPLKNWLEVSWQHVRDAAAHPTLNHRPTDPCLGCGASFPPLPHRADDTDPDKSSQDHQANLTALRDAQLQRAPTAPAAVGQRPSTAKEKLAKDASGVSESGRYMCETCGYWFCIDCDLLAHEVVHNCPGCQSRPAPAAFVNSAEGEIMAAAAAEETVH